MTKEQAIEIVEGMVKSYIKADECGLSNNDFKHEIEAMQTALNILKEKDKEIEKLQKNVDYQVLCDFLINSVSDEEPIWTEKHIEELLENFEMRWKDAHK